LAALEKARQIPTNTASGSGRRSKKSGARGPASFTAKKTS
jgi:hypothetical protein